MKSLFQNICRRWPREGGREGEPLCRKHFTSCSSCLLLKPGASGLGQGVLATPPRSGQGSRASARLGPSGGGGPPVRARFPTHIPGSAATDRSGPSSCAPPGRAQAGGGGRGAKGRAEAEVPTSPAPREPGAGPACQASAAAAGRPLAAAAAAPFCCSSSSLLPASHTTPTWGSREAVTAASLHPLAGHTVLVSAVGDKATLPLASSHPRPGREGGRPVGD